MKLSCRLGFHNWLPWQAPEEVCRESKVVEHVNYHARRDDGGICSHYSEDKDKITTTTTVMRRMIQRRYCGDCNVEDIRVSFEEVGMEKVECVPGSKKETKKKGARV